MLFGLQRHLYSSTGEAGLLELHGRLQIWVGPLTDAWHSRNEADGFLRLYEVLTDAIMAVDRFDLRTQQIRLRPITATGAVPVGVICKLARALVEHLADGDKLAEQNALERIVALTNAPGSVVWGFRAALAEFLFEEGDFDRAVAIAEEIRAVATAEEIVGVYGDHLLYRLLSSQTQAGKIVDSAKIGFHDLSDRFCEQPFAAFSTAPAGKHGVGSVPAFACHCYGMLPYPLAGSISLDDADEAVDIWNGPEAQEIRRSILEGDFTYCLRSVCGRILNNTLPKRDEITDARLRDVIDNKRTRLETAPRTIVLSHDESCNLACPSCRTKILTIRNEAREELDRYVDRIILPLMQDAEVFLHLSGDGDPFASKHYRKLLYSLDPALHGDVKVFLHSNGLLLTPKEWKSLSHIQHMIKHVAISIDAAEQTTYEDLRRPGKWDTLKSNMEFLADLRRKGIIDFLGTNFVVQKKNFEQMPAFVEISQSWAVDKIYFYKLLGTIHPDPSEPSELEANAVVNEGHPDHPRFLEVLKHPIMRSKEVELYNLAG